MRDRKSQRDQRSRGRVLLIANLARCFRLAGCPSEDHKQYQSRFSAFQTDSTGSTTASLRTLHSNPAPLIYHGQYDGTYSIHDWRCIMMSMAIIFSIVLLHAFRAAPDVHGKSLSPRRHVTTSVSLSQVHEYY